ncbi:hypothetical protein SVAN01_00459 [Stagonosporopsis vannaccii]|nr:hypothetical protein SVAN01_00459 [Stagonosporopsis vannaccii]
MEQSSGQYSPPQYRMEDPHGSPQVQAPSLTRVADNVENVQTPEAQALAEVASAGGKRATPAVVAPGDDGRGSRKRRVSSGGELANEVAGDFPREQPTIFDLRETNLDLRGKLQEKDQTIHRIRLQNSQGKVAHQADLNEAVAKHLHITDKLEKEILRLKKNENKHKRQIASLQQRIEERNERIQGLEGRLEHLALAYTRPTVKQKEPTLVPDHDPKIRNHPEYKHPNAPKTHMMRPFFNPMVAYLPGQGKVRVTTYGSTKYWDLGLCRVRFEYGSTCHVQGCEYRHEPLTQDEQIYMSFLEPKGPEFLKLVTAKNLRHLDLVLVK